MNIKQQQGVALVVSLVMLMVLTIMGVSSMRNSTLRLQGAKNTQEHNVAFQTAQACIAHSIRNADLTMIDVSQDFNFVMPNYPGLTAKCTTTYVGCGQVWGGSLERVGGQLVFETTSDGFSSGGSKSTIVAAMGKNSAASCAEQ